MNKLFFTSILVLLMAVLVWNGYLQSQLPKTAYVNLSTLYNDFELKKELEKKLTGVQQARKYIIDSLEVQLTVLSAELERTKTTDAAKLNHFQRIRDDYMDKKQQFEASNQVMSEQYSGQITKQLNQYVQDYGKLHHYDYVYGAEGSGALMYAIETRDITKEVMQYINECYKGNNK